MSFHYQSTKDDSYADIYLEVYESPYFNANDAIEERLTGYETATNFELLQPIECGKYTLNKLPACSFGATWPNEGEPADTSLIILSVGQDGTGYEVTFSATNDLYNRFLPVAEYMVKSISFDPDKVASSLGFNSDDPDTTNPVVDPNAISPELAGNP